MRRTRKTGSFAHAAGDKVIRLVLVRVSQKVNQTQCLTIRKRSDRELGRYPRGSCGWLPASVLAFRFADSSSLVINLAHQFAVTSDPDHTPPVLF